MRSHKYQALLGLLLRRVAAVSLLCITPCEIRFECNHTAYGSDTHALSVSATDKYDRPYAPEGNCGWAMRPRSRTLPTVKCPPLQRNATKPQRAAVKTKCASTSPHTQRVTPRQDNEFIPNSPDVHEVEYGVGVRAEESLQGHDLVGVQDGRKGAPERSRVSDEKGNSHAGGQREQ